jgi:DNA-binding protein HU-beta
MNKTQLIQVVADKTELSKKDAEAAVNATFEAIVEAMKAGDKVQLVGFGAFAVKDISSKEYVNRFGEGQKVVKPACKKPTFVAGKGLKDALN